MKMKVKKAELVFVPLPVIGHIVSILEFAKLLVDRDDRFSITVLVMKLPLLQHSAVVDTHIRSISASVSSGRIQFIYLPQFDDPQLTSTSLPNSETLSATYALCCSVEDQKPLVRNAIKQLLATQSESTPRLAGFVFDMLCTSLVDVADKLGVPSYIFFPASAAFLDLMFHLQTLHDHQGVDVTELVDSDAELVVPSFVNSVPARVLPCLLANKRGGGSTVLLNSARGLSGKKGIIVNTCMELESHAINSFLDHGSRTCTSPPVYPVGPMLNLKHRENLDHDDDTNKEIMNWLDHQPPSSVVFLCFGSNGVFPLDQAKEIAQALEHSQYRFLWSLRQPPPKGEIEIPGDYTDLEQVLPRGFLDRTAGIGKVIGWAPQSAVLAHPSIGGFVSHCGWNSILESIWCGVPIATWPIYAEQQVNAFQLVKELELAIEISIDYKIDNPRLVRAGKIENGIRNLMNEDSQVKRRAKETKENIKNTLIEGGSSYTCLGRLIEDMIANIV